MSVRYKVEVEPGDDGPPAELLDRLATIAAHRLSRLNERDGHHPVVGAGFDMLDNLEGPYLWERTDEDLAENPPTRVDFEVVAVDPVDPPTDGTPVRVRVTVPF